MPKDSFSLVRMDETNPKWESAIEREGALYQRENEVRSEFNRDYTRILHSMAYRRLKHKTQVFFATKHDHICTRIEHVAHVSSVSYTISKQLGLNTELATAISVGHDLGHAPFGHAGSDILNTIAIRELKTAFWHERNSLHFVDNIETLPNDEGKDENLKLTYAVRDGIVSHCGEVKAESIVPRDDAIDLAMIDKPGEYEPYTWEGCVVKIADKISYLGRDIEDALLLNILSPGQRMQLEESLANTIGINLNELNNTVLMHNFISNLCESSSLETGLKFSKQYTALIDAIGNFNDKNIYQHKRLDIYKDYAKLIIESIFNTLLNMYSKQYTYRNIWRHHEYYPTLVNYYLNWLLKYSDMKELVLKGEIVFKKRNELRDANKLSNKTIYLLKNEKDFKRSIIDFISGMTDSFAIKIFSEITSF